MDTTQQEESISKPFLILLPMLITAFLGMFSEMSLNIALSDLITELQVNAATIQWLTTGFMLVISILVPISALLIQTFTTRKLILTATILFTLGTVIAASSTSFSMLLIGRLIQAAGTGLTLPLLFNTVFAVTPLHKRGSMMGIIGLVVMFSPAISPTISGYIMQKLNWTWLFWVLVPFLLVNLVLIFIFVKNVSTITKPRIDFLSLILSTIGFGGVVYGFSSVGNLGWTSPITLTSLILGIIVIGLFAWRQLTMNIPLLNLRAFKYPMFTIGVLLVMISMMIIFAFNIILPMYLQTGLAVSVLTVGLLMLPGGILNGVMSPITGKLYDQFGPKGLVRVGLAIITIVLFILTTVSTETNLATIVALHCLLLVGVSMTLTPAQTNGLNQLPKELHPHGTAIINTLQQLGGATGTALCISILTAGQVSFIESTNGNANDPTVAANALVNGVQNSFMFIAFVALIGFILSLFIKKSTSAN